METMQASTSDNNDAPESPDHSADKAGPTVIVVSGIPRSGTSLMMRILERAGVTILSDAERPPDASNPHGYFELEAVKRSAEDVSWLDGAGGMAVKVIHALLPRLPGDRRYRVVMMRRDLEEVVRSQARMLERQGGESDSAQDAALVEIYRKQLVRTSQLLSDDPRFEALDVDYNQLVREPRGELRRVIGFLGLESSSEELEPIVDASLYRERNRAGGLPGGSTT